MEPKFWSHMTNDKNDVDMTKTLCNMVTFFSLVKECEHTFCPMLPDIQETFEGSQALTTNTDKGSIKMNMEHWWNDTDRGN
jgi:hypothetical protein